MAETNKLTFENETPEWENVGVEPPSTLKSDGFLAGYKPPADYFNWFFNRIYKAVQEIKDKSLTNELGGDVYFTEDNSSSAEEPTIDPSVQSLIDEVATRLADSIVSISTKMGNIDDLITDNKDCIVSAINSLADSKVNYDDTLIIQCVLAEPPTNYDANFATNETAFGVVENSFTYYIGTYEEV